MSAADPAREAILGAVQANLAAARARGETPDRDPRTVPLTGWNRPADLGAHFRARLAAVGAHVHEARDETEAAAALRCILEGIGARRLAVSNAPIVQRVASAGAAELVHIRPDAERALLLEADAGLTAAQWGIAETGTLVLESERERHRLVSLLPPVHVALLSTRNVLASLDEALERVATGGRAAMSRAVTFITGPSRTADIELRLVIGVHGPEVLHVVLLHEDESEERER